MIVFSTKAELDDYVNAVVAKLVIEHRAATEELIRKATGQLSSPARTIAEGIARRTVRLLADRILRPLPDVPLPHTEPCLPSSLASTSSSADSAS